MFELKPVSKDGIDAVLEKAKHYRLLNEPWEADSICRDVLAADPDNQQALIIRILSLTDRFGGWESPNVSEPRALIRRLVAEYDRAYYSGIISERFGKAQRARGLPGWVAYQALREAMSWYEKAEAIAPSGNVDARLRWNACARMIMEHRGLRPAPGDEREHPLE